MALALASEVIAELNLSVSAMGFTEAEDLEAWIDRLLDWVSAKISALVGSTNYVITKEGVVQAEILLTAFHALRRVIARRGSNAEGGFAIGSLRIDSDRASIEAVSVQRAQLLKEAEALLAPYHTVSYSRALFYAYEGADKETWEDLEDEWYDRLFIRKV
jgi:hypothetical protein